MLDGPSDCQVRKSWVSNIRVFDQVLLNIAAKPGDQIMPKVLVKSQVFGKHYREGIIRSIRRDD